MGGSESVVRNVDKRTSRREHKVHFEAAVQRFKAAPFAAPPRPESASAADADRFVRVCVRKRPMFPHERQQGEFDVVTCLPGRVVVHDARMHPDMRHMFMNHHDFAFDEAFGEEMDNDAVYTGTAHELVGACLDGNSATVMMYGQTGSGKTYTMSAIYERVAADLFDSIAEDRVVTTSFYELSGDKCFDMLKGGEPCSLTQAGDGSVHPFPSVETPVRDAVELLALIRLAAKLRATAATGVHDQSSRSHAVCRIFIDGPGGNGEGCLTLVDLAGSEHRIDNAEHNAERRKEGAKINASLAALKDCIRAASAGAKFVAYRQNRLTQLLRGCFCRMERHQTVVIATVSPSSKDTEHSMNTLRHACIMDGQGEKTGAQSAHLEGGVVTKEKLGEIDVSGIAREKRAAKKAEADRPSDNWGNPPAAPAHQAKQSNTAARASLDRRAVNALPAGLRQALQAARTEFGGNRQRARIGRAGSVAEPVAFKDPEPTTAVTSCGSSEAPPAELLREEGRDSDSDPPAPGRSAPGDAVEAIQAVGADGAKALELFRLFVSQGRQAREWRKNDLRLINSCIVPVLFGEASQIDWAHPNIALEQLSELLEEKPVPSHLFPNSTSKPATRPPLPPPISAGSAVGSRAGAEDAPCADQQQDRRSRSRGQLIRTPVSREVATRSDLSECPAPPRSASPAPRGATPPSTTSSATSSAPMSHRDAVRARREALEKQRQRSLSEALEKREPTGREGEIAALEQQIQSGKCSSAALVGLKKRLAALKAQAIREQRAKEKQRERVNAEPVPPARASPLPTAPEPEAPPAQADAGYSSEACTHAAEDWPEPGRPPPRARAPEATPACRGDAQEPWSHTGGYGPPVGFGRRGSGQRGTGAAAAPWGNAFSVDDDG